MPGRVGPEPAGLRDVSETWPAAGSGPTAEVSQEPHPREADPAAQPAGAGMLGFCDCATLSNVELIVSSAVVFALIMDPLGNVPLFLTALRSTAPERRRRVIVRELLIALVVMLVFLFGGRAFLDLFDIESSALTVGGGVILMLIALRMIFPTPERSLREPSPDDEPFIVPLAVPYFAGPSLLAMEVVVVSGNPAALTSYLVALILAWLVSAVVLYFSQGLHRVVGEKALVAVERLMGMVLVIIATQMTLSGIAEFFAVRR